MSAEPTIPPSPRRLRQAWRAGIRPRAPWLGRGLLVLAGAAAVEACAQAQVLEPGFWRTAALQAANGRGWDWPVVLEAFSATSLGLGAVMVLATTVASLPVSGIGPLASRERRRLGAIGRVRPGVVAVAVALGATVVLLLAFTEVVAGASRAVDASLAALALLWRLWFVRLLTGTGLILLGFGAIDAALGRRRVHRALYQSVEAAREQQARERRA